MDHYSDLGSSDWKINAGGGAMSKQNYLAYLNLKRAENPSDCLTEVVTVRRTRRVLYRYETTKNESKGRMLKADTKPKDISIMEHEEEKLKNNISPKPCVKSGNNCDISTKKRQKKNLSVNFQTKSTLQSERECKSLNNFQIEPIFKYQGEFGNSSKLVKKSFQEVEESNDNCNKKEIRKRPISSSQSGSLRIAHKKIKKSVDGDSVRSNGTEFEPDNNLVQKDGESNDEIKFMLTGKSLNHFSPQLFVAEEVLEVDEREEPSTHQAIFGIVKMPISKHSIEKKNDALTIEEEPYPGGYMSEIDNFIPVPDIQGEIEIESTPEITPKMENALHDIYIAPKKDEQVLNNTGVITNSVEFIYDDEQITNDTLGVSQHVLDHRSGRKQMENDIFVVLEPSVQPMKEEKHLQESFLLEPNVIVEDNCLSHPPFGLEFNINNTLEIIPATDKTLNHRILQSNDDEETLLGKAQTKHSLELSNDQYHKNTGSTTKHSLERNNAVQQMKKDSVRIKIHSHVAIIDGQQKTIHPLGITKHSLESNSYEQTIIKDSSRTREKSNPLSDKNQVTGNTTFSPQSNADECSITKKGQKRAEHSQESYKDIKRLKKDTLRIPEHSLKTNYGEQKVRRDTLITSKHLFESKPNNDERQITEETPKVTIDTTRELKHPSETRSNEEEVAIILCSLRNAPELHGMMKHPVQADDGEKQTTKDIMNITERNNDEQEIINSTLRITGTSPSLNNVEQQRTRYNSRITEVSLEPNDDNQQRTEDIYSVSEHPLEATNNDGHCPEKHDEQQIKRDALKITEHSVNPNSDEQQILKDILKISKHSLELKDEQELNNSTLRITVPSPSLNNVEQQRTIYNSGITEASLDSNDDNQQITEDIYHISEHSLEDINNDGHPPETYDEQQIKRDTLRITEHYVNPDSDEQQTVQDTLRISKHSVELNDEQEIKNSTLRMIGPSPSLNNVEQQRTIYNSGITEVSLDSNDDNQQRTEDIYSVSEHSLEYTNNDGHRPETYDEQQIKRDAPKITENSVNLNSDEQQILKDTLKISKHSIEVNDEQEIKNSTLRITGPSPSVKNVEQQITEDIYSISEHTKNDGQSPETYNEPLIKRGTMGIKIHSIEPNNADCQIKEIWKTSENSLEADNKERQITKEHFPEPNYDDTITGDSFRISEQSLEHERNEQEMNTDILRITEHNAYQITKEALKISEHSQEEEQIAKDLGITKHSLESNDDEHQITVDSLGANNVEHLTKRDILRIIECSLDPEHDVCQKTEVLKRPEHYLEASDEQQIECHSLGTTEYSAEPNINEQQITNDTSETPEHNLGHTNDEQEIKRDTPRITEYVIEPNDEESKTTKDTLELPEASEDEQQMPKYNLRTTERSPEHYNERQITNDTVRISKRFVNPKGEERLIRQDNLEIEELTHYKEWQITKGTLKISKHSIEAYEDELAAATDEWQITEGQYSLGSDYNEKQTVGNMLNLTPTLIESNDGRLIGRDTLKIPEHSLELHHSKQKITRESLRSTRLSLEPKPDNNEQPMIKEILKLRNDTLEELDHSLEFSDCEQQDSLELTNQSQQVDEEQQITKDTLKITEHSLELHHSKQKITRESLETTRLSLEPKPDNNEQPMMKEILKLRNDTLEELDHSLEFSDCEQQDSLELTKQSLQGDEEQQITKDTLKISEHSGESKLEERSITEGTSRIIEHCLEPSSYEDQVTNYAKLLQNISLLEHIDEIENGFFEEEVEVEINDEIELISIDTSLDNHSLKSNSDDEISNESSRGTISFLPEQEVQRKEHEDIPPKSDSEMEIPEGPCPGFKKSPEKQLSSSGPIQRKEQDDIPPKSKSEMEIPEGPCPGIKKSPEKQLSSSGPIQRKEQEDIPPKSDSEMEIPKGPCPSINKSPEKQLSSSGPIEREEQEEIPKSPCPRIRKSTQKRLSSFGPIQRTEQGDIPPKCKSETKMPKSPCPRMKKSPEKQLSSSGPIARKEQDDIPLKSKSEMEIPKIPCPTIIQMKKSSEKQLSFSRLIQRKEQEDIPPKSDSEMEMPEGPCPIIKKSPEKQLSSSGPIQRKEQEDIPQKSKSEMEIPKSPCPRVIQITKSSEKQLSSSGSIQRQEQLHKNDMSDKLSASRFVPGLKFQPKAEIQSGKPTRMEVVHYNKTTDNFHRKYCTFCNIGCTNAIVLKKHMIRCRSRPENIQRDPVKIFYCKFCNFGITDEVSFRQHEEKCQNKVICKPANSSSKPVIQETGSKAKRKRSAIGRFECPSCDYTTDNIGHMDMHRKIHSKVPLCICDVCKKGFNRLESLKLHMFNHISVAQTVKEVDKVDVWEGNASKSTLELNIKNKEYKLVKYQCSKCKYATPITNAMEKHFKSIHLNLMNFKCNLCSFTTKVKANLSKHLNWHLREKTYKCSYCSYETITKSYIKHHENQVHLKSISFKCDSCDFIAYRKENLKIHINSMHSKSKRYPCKQCDYFCYVQSNLISHIKRVHEGIKRKYKQK